MENATKALLIAAAVLVVIGLIALGVRLLNSTSETKKASDEVSTQLQDQTGKAKNAAVNAFQGLQIE